MTVDIDDIRAEVRVILDNCHRTLMDGDCYFNQFDFDTAEMLIADYVKQKLDESVEELKEVGFGWWDDEE